SAPRALASAARKQRKRRTLWGRDHGGRFSTRGANSVATVRGTRWMTQERCAGTLTRVTEGAVAVRDLRRHKTVVVRAGHTDLAREGGRAPPRGGRTRDRLRRPVHGSHQAAGGPRPL